MIFYRFILLLVSPLIVLGLGWRRLWHRETTTSICERFGGGTSSGTQSRLLWLHAASNGELTSARQVVETLLDRAPKLHILITTNTQTGRTLVETWALPRLTVSLAPLDFLWALHRFFGRHQPAALLIIENELWPNRLAQCHTRGIPVFVIGARMSQKSARLWQRFPGFTLQLLNSIHFLSAQDSKSENRFRSLGMAANKIGRQIDLKSTVFTRRLPAPSVLPYDRSWTFLAASTHEGEEDLVLDAFVAARRNRPELRLILAPRHPRRRDAIEAAIDRRALPFATRSRGQSPVKDTAVYLADTMGEMEQWYAAAGFCFVGGSMADHGGHTPFEPATYGAAILHGPYVSNFSTAYAGLDASDGALSVVDAGQMTAAIGRLAGDAEAQSDIAARASVVLSRLADPEGFDPFYSALSDALGVSLSG